MTENTNSVPSVSRTEYLTSAGLFVRTHKQVTSRFVRDEKRVVDITGGYADGINTGLDVLAAMGLVEIVEDVPVPAPSPTPASPTDAAALPGK